MGCFPEAHGLDFALFLTLDVRFLGHACVIMFCVRERKRREKTGGREDGRKARRDGVRGERKREERARTFTCVSLTLTADNTGGVGDQARVVSVHVCVCEIVLHGETYTRYKLRDVHMIETHVERRTYHIQTHVCVRDCVTRRDVHMIQTQQRYTCTSYTNTIHTTMY